MINKIAFSLLGIILIISGVLYFQFMNNKKQGEEKTIPQEVSNSVILKTNFGDIGIEFFDKEAPKTVENFKKLVGEGFYDGVKFHRIIKGFMIQGGDPLTKDDTNQLAWGTGGPGYSFEDEIYSSNANVVGSIAMANSGPDTNGSQFFINVANNNFLDQKHTVFGKVVNGMEIVTKIENTPVGGRDVPVDPIIIESAILSN
jgi:cyclophilin family peptidyl-prolyl cis-trans isomerase